MQIEAALSRMPGAGGRVSLQTRLDEVRYVEASRGYITNIITNIFLIYFLMYCQIYIKKGGIHLHFLDRWP